jgi:hypothetical protein
MYDTLLDMSFYICRSAYQALLGNPLLAALEALARQGPACRRFLECLAQQSRLCAEERRAA